MSSDFGPDHDGTLEIPRAPRSPLPLCTDEIRSDTLEVSTGAIEMDLNPANDKDVVSDILDSLVNEVANDVVSERSISSFPSSGPIVHLNVDQLTGSSSGSTLKKEVHMGVAGLVSESLSTPDRVDKDLSGSGSSTPMHEPQSRDSFGKIDHPVVSQPGLPSKTVNDTKKRPLMIIAEDETEMIEKKVKLETDDDDYNPEPGHRESSHREVSGFVSEPGSSLSVHEKPDRCSLLFNISPAQIRHLLELDVGSLRFVSIRDPTAVRKNTIAVPDAQPIKFLRDVTRMAVMRYELLYLNFNTHWGFQKNLIERIFDIEADTMIIENTYMTQFNFHKLVRNKRRVIINEELKTMHSDAYIAVIRDMFSRKYDTRYLETPLATKQSEHPLSCYIPYHLMRAIENDKDLGLLNKDDASGGIYINDAGFELTLTFPSEEKHWRLTVKTTN